MPHGEESGWVCGGTYTYVKGVGRPSPAIEAKCEGDQ